MEIVVELLFTLVVLVSYVGLGEGVRKIFRLAPFAIYISCLVGAGVYSFVLSILGLFFGLKLLTIVLLLIGQITFWSSQYRVQMKWTNDMALSKQTLIYLIFCFILAFYPSTYFDPLNYHLVGVFKWSEANRLIHFPSSIPLMHNSFADYLYFPFGLLLPGEGSNRLISIQVCSQLVTFILGIASFSLILPSVVKKSFSDKWIPFLIFALLTRASLQHKSLIAKNDWIALSWFLLGIQVILDKEFSEKKELFLGYFILGLSIGAKLSYMVPAFIFGVSFLLTTPRSKVKVHLAGITIFLITLAPYLARNWMWTSNPIFPLGSTYFESKFLGPSWIEGMAFFDIGKGDISWDVLNIKLLRIFSYEAICYLSIIPFFYFNTFSQRTKFLLVGYFLFLVFFIFGMGTYSEMRHFGPCALAVNFLSVYGLYLLTAKFKPIDRYQRFLRRAFSVVIIFNMFALENQLNPIPSALRSGDFFPREQSLINEKRGFHFAEKIRQQIPSNERVAIIDDTPPFYFSFLNIIRLWDDPVIDTSLDKCKKMDCVIEVLQNHNIAYLVESNTSFDPYYRPGIKDGLLNLMKMVPESLIISNNEGNLVSVAILARKLKQ